MKVDTIVGYTYRGEISCPACVVVIFKRVAGQRADGNNAEACLNIVAKMAGIDRQDEASFDSHRFPKVIFLSDQSGDEPDRCDGCKEHLIDWTRYRY